MRVLVLNPGSSSLKVTVLEPPGRDPLASAVVDWGADATLSSGPASAGAAVAAAIDEAGLSMPSIDAIGYRVVHGGTRFMKPTVIDDAVIEAIEELATFAPLHNRIAARTIREFRERLPSIPHVATFDTAFHANLPPAGYRYPVPREWFQSWGVRRFGFHGLSVAWSVERAAELLDRQIDDLRLVVAHLGSGCSVTAVDSGRSIDTSMGMTPLEGLMMGSRAGSIDPGIIIDLLRRDRLTLTGLADVLDHQSGLLGVSGASADVRELLTAEATGDEAATLALELFVRRAAAGIAACATALPWIDAVVFTGGIGEHSGPIRHRIVGRLAVLGVGAINDASVDSDGVLGKGDDGPRVLRIEAREDLVIAGSVLATLEGP